MSKTNHIQCRLARGSVHQMSWIPEEYAVKGNYVKLRDRGGEWEDGWIIMQLCTVMPTDDVLKNADNYKTQRQASDI